MIPDAKNLLGRKEVLLSLAILVLAVAFRIAIINRGGLYVDELWTWHVVGYGLRDFFANMRQDMDPPLYYLLLEGWRHLFGDSEAALRSMSLPASLAAIAGMLFFFPRIIGAPQALIAGLVMAMQPLEILLAREARMYALGEMLVVGSVIALWQLVTTRKAIWGVAYFAVSVVLCYTHYVGALVVFATGAVALMAVLTGDLDARTLLLVLGIDALVAATLAPWLWFFLLTGTELGTQSSVHWGWVQSFTELAKNFGKGFGGLFVAPVALAVIALGLVAGRKDPIFLKTIAGFFLLAIIPMGMQALASANGGPWIRPHPTVLVMPWIAAVIGLAAWRIPAGWLRQIALAALLVGLGAMAVWSEFRNPYSDYSDMFANMRERGTKVVFSYPDDTRLAADYYGGGLTVHNIDTRIPGDPVDPSQTACGGVVALSVMVDGQLPLALGSSKIPSTQLPGARFPLGWEEMVPMGASVFYSDNASKPGRIVDHQIFYFAAPRCQQVK